MTYDPDETICAVASAAGGAARGMIRVSGPQALAVVEPLFRTEAGVPVEWPTIAMAIVGNLRIPLTEDRPGANRLQSTSDERSETMVPCELFVWPNQRSYTREPVVELHTVGSAPILDAVLAAVCWAGARLAEPGEFTLRAFLAGRIDLAQAEAVLGVIDASRANELENALAQLAGGLSYPLRTMRDELLQLLAELEAGLDFVEEDIQFVSRREVLTRLKGAEELLAKIDRQMVSRQISPTTFQIALVGPPNAGKSSLFNSLTRRFGIRGEEKKPFAAEALVSPACGTTRDYLIAAINVDGVRCELLDTAGVDTCEAGRGEMSTSLRQTGNTAEIEETAAALAAEHRHRAAIRVLCLEASRFFDHASCDASAATLIQNCDILALTKADLLSQPIGITNFGQGVPTVLTSSNTGKGFDELAKLIGGVLASANRTQRGHAVASTAERCRESIRCAGQAVASALELAEHDRGAELIAAEIRVSLDELGKVVGAAYTEDLLDRIFSTFCIGK